MEFNRELIIREAKKYADDEKQRFMDEIEWQDWMEAYTEGAEITEKEAETIDKVLEEIWIESRRIDPNEIETVAKSLFDGGWRPEDREQMIAEYELHEEDVDEIIEVMETLM